MEKLSIKQIAYAVDGAVDILDSESDHGQEVFACDISIDSRKVKKGDLFVAIKGENFDGHEYIQKAYEMGGSIFISQVPVDGVPNVVIVKDTKKALLDLARYYRRLFPTFIVGVTGSVGKTSTKEMINAVLSFKQSTLKTQGNLNNEIGLPLTLMGLQHTHVYGVIEMGMSNFDEIRELSLVTQPNVAVITNIGVSHIEVLGSRENILKAKLEILVGMSTDSPVVLNVDDDMLRQASAEIEHPIITIGIDNHADITASNIEISNWQTKFDINYYGKTINATIPVMGKHHVYNALSAFSVGLMADMPPENIAKAYMLYQNAAMRQEISSKNDIVSIKDCYNASPDSMLASLSVLSDFDCTGRRLAVLGDMLELGQVSEEKHLEIGKYVGCSKIDYLICYGDISRQIKRGAVMVGMRNVSFFEDAQETARYIKSQLTQGDVILYKASRGVKLEEVIKLVEVEMENSDE